MSQDKTKEEIRETLTNYLTLNVITQEFTMDSIKAVRLADRIIDWHIYQLTQAKGEIEIKDKAIEQWKLNYDSLQSLLTQKDKEIEALREGWISVDERLPKFIQDNAWGQYLTISESGKQQVLYYDTEYSRFTTKPHEPNITHWMPLPPNPSNEKGCKS